MRKQFFVVTGHDYGEDIVTLTIHTQGKADSSPSHHQVAASPHELTPHLQGEL